jgi:hypothetical protein
LYPGVVLGKEHLPGLLVEGLPSSAGFVSCTDHMLLNGRMILNDKLEKMRKKTAFSVLMYSPSIVLGKE